VLRLRLAPAFLGSVIALETLEDGVNHLLSAFPTARELDWMRPWFGGLHAAIYRPGPGFFPSTGRMHDETFTVEETAEQGHDGRLWRGLTVRSALRGEWLRGLELTLSYLLLPGSYVVAMRLSVTNHTTATLPVEAALLAYLQPDGTTDGVDLLPGDAVSLPTRVPRALRLVYTPCNDWVGVCNARSGRSMALVCGAPSAMVYGLDSGTWGAHAAVQLTPRLGPNGMSRSLAFLALATDVDEARSYRTLSSAQELP
jgi:hypothetical protein